MTGRGTEMKCAPAGYIIGRPVPVGTVMMKDYGASVGDLAWIPGNVFLYMLRQQYIFVYPHLIYPFLSGIIRGTDKQALSPPWPPVVCRPDIPVRPPGALLRVMTRTDHRTFRKQARGKDDDTAGWRRTVQRDHGRSPEETRSVHAVQAPGRQRKSPAEGRAFCSISMDNVSTGSTMERAGSEKRSGDQANSASSAQRSISRSRLSITPRSSSASPCTTV